MKKVIFNKTNFSGVEGISWINILNTVGKKTEIKRNCYFTLDIGT